MPYIKQADRTYIDGELAAGREPKLIRNPGHLNYIITSIVHNYIRQNGEDYATFNEVVGVLECAKLELYRRKVAPYEDTKIEQNGDV